MLLSRMTIPRAWALAGMAGLCALGGVAQAQQRSLGVPAGVQSAPVGTEVQLIRQDQSDCQNSNVSAADPSLIGGTAWVAKGGDGNVTVQVAITAKANARYNFYLKCVRQLGTIATSDEGVGFGTFQFPANAVGAVFAFDMYPDGAPSGDKYQSVSVRLP